MTNQEIAAHRFKAFDAEMLTFTMNQWPNMKRAERDAKQHEIEERHGYRHGWIEVNGEGFNHESAFPDQKFPRFPADQGLSD